MKDFSSSFTCSYTTVTPIQLLWEITTKAINDTITNNILSKNDQHEIQPPLDYTSSKESDNKEKETVEAGIPITILNKLGKLQTSQKRSLAPVQKSS